MTNTTEPQTATEREPRYTLPPEELRAMVQEEIESEIGDADDASFRVAARIERRYMATRMKAAPTTDQTPDAVRAAIAEALDDAFADTIDAYVENDENANAYLRGDLLRTVFTVLDQIGALRPVGDGVSKAELRAAIETFHEAAFGYEIRDLNTWNPLLTAKSNLLALLDRLPIPDAAARAGDGAT